jgi:hypothetical protein
VCVLTFSSACLQEEHARKALETCGDEINAALEWLMDNPYEPANGWQQGRV